MAKKNQVTKPSHLFPPFKDQNPCNLLSKSSTNFQISPTCFYCLWLVSYSGTSYSVMARRMYYFLTGSFCLPLCLEELSLLLSEVVSFIFVWYSIV